MNVNRPLRRTLIDANHLNAGFSLVELSVSVALMAIIIVYLTQSFSAQQRTYVMVDQVTEAQQSMRAISDLVEREVRLAGFMVDEGGAVCGVDAANGPDTFFVSDASAIDPTNAITAQLGGRLAPGSVPAAGNTALVLTGGDTVVLDAQPAYDNDADGVNEADFRVGAGAIVYDRDNPARGAACGIVTAVAPPGNLTVNFLSAALGAGGAGQLVVVPAHVYQVNANAQLLRDGLLLSEDVEDLQVAYFFDLNGNLTVDGGENPGSAGTVYAPSAWDNSNLREVRLNFVVRTRGTDPSFTQGAFQARENRVAPAVTAADPQLRRRVHSTTVRTRNVGNRGLLG